MQVFGTKGQKFYHFPGTKGQWDKLKNLAKGWDGPGQPKSATGWARTAKIWDGTWYKTGQSRKGLSKTEKRMF